MEEMQLISLYMDLEIVVRTFTAEEYFDVHDVMTGKYQKTPALHKTEV